MAGKSTFFEGLKKKDDDDEKKPVVDENGSIESPAGDGRDNLHQVLAVQLVGVNGDQRKARAVLYGSIVGTIDHNPSFGIAFSFEGKFGMEEVLIAGRNLQRIYDKLAAGKREVIRPSEETVESITFKKVAEES